MRSGILGFPVDQNADEELDIQRFEAPGAHTWTKPAWAEWVRVVVIGGGGGGGSGRKGAADVSRWGGSGAGGGGCSVFECAASALPSTVDLQVGAGGLGGAAIETDSTNGLSGQAGAPSRFGTYCGAMGAPAGGFGGSTPNGNVVGGLGLYPGTQGGGHTTPVRGPSWFSGQGGTPAPPISGTGVLSPRFLSPGGIVRPGIEPSGFVSLAGSGAVGVLAGEGAAGGDAIGPGGGGGGGSAGTDGAADSGRGGNGGYGAVYVICWGGPVRPVNVQSFDSSGVWRKPSDHQFTVARVFVLGAGGGGASGSNNDAAHGGSGGGGGGGAIAEFPLAILPDEVDVVVGAGGVGGAGAPENSNGIAGGRGGSSAFGVLLSAYGGLGGIGDPSGPHPWTASPVAAPAPYPGGIAGGGTNSNGASSGQAGFSTGGGGGSGGAFQRLGGRPWVPNAQSHARALQPAHNGAPFTGPPAPIADGPGFFGGTGGGGAGGRGSSSGLANPGQPGGRGGGGGGSNGTWLNAPAAGGDGGNGYVCVVCQ